MTKVSELLDSFRPGSYSYSPFNKSGAGDINNNGNITNNHDETNIENSTVEVEEARSALDEHPAVIIQEPSPEKQRKTNLSDTKMKNKGRCESDCLLTSDAEAFGDSFQDTDGIDIQGRLL